MELVDVIDVVVPPSLDATSMRRLTDDVNSALGSSARVICLRGMGSDVFCTGLAIESEEARGAVDVGAFASLLARLVDAPRPLVAIVDGAALGGGAGLAAACDWVIASDRATFGLPELLWGLVPAIIWPVLVERVPPQRLKAWLLTAHAHSALEAHTHGLVDELVSGDLERSVARRVRALQRLEPHALRRARQWARESRHLPIAEALAEGARITADRLDDPIVLERLESFGRGELPWQK